MSKYTVFHGEFSCHVCKQPVNTLRSYSELKKLTWMCKEKHLSEVDLDIKKKKKHHE